MKPEIKIALQLYSVRNDFEKDFLSTLKAVKSMGYDGVEFAGFYKHDPTEINAVLKDLDLRAISAHVDRSVLMKDLNGQAALYEALGCEYVALPWSSEEKELPGSNGYESFLEDVRTMSKALGKRGLALLYHNHDFEFHTIGGRHLLDIMLSDTKPEELGSELDLCWARVGGEEPAQYLRKIGNRVPVVHFKDYSGKADGPVYDLIGQEPKVGEKPKGFEFRPLGCGVQNLKELLAATYDIGAQWAVVEQDEPSMGLSALECAKKSLENLKAAIKG